MFNDNRDSQTFRGSISIQYYCPDCEEPHVMKFGSVDDAGEGFALAHEYVKYRMRSGGMRDARIAAFGFVGEQVYGLELLVDDDGAKFLLSQFDKEATARLLMSVMAHVEPHASFAFIKDHGTALVVGSPNDIAGIAARTIPQIGREQPAQAAPQAASANAPKSPKQAMSKDEFNRLMGL